MGVGAFPLMFPTSIQTHLKNGGGKPLYKGFVADDCSFGIITGKNSLEVINPHTGERYLPCFKTLLMYLTPCCSTIHAN